VVFRVVAADSAAAELQEDGDARTSQLGT